jgi:hypothetical protein
VYYSSLLGREYYLTAADLTVLRRYVILDYPELRAGLKPTRKPVVYIPHRPYSTHLVFVYSKSIIIGMWMREIIYVMRYYTCCEGIVTAPGATIDVAYKLIK